METEKHTLTEDVLGDFGFRLVWEYSEHVADVTAYEISGRTCDGKNTALFMEEGWNNSSDDTEDITEAEKYLKGFVKWDGCTELDQGCPHWCGPSYFKKHFALLEHIYKKAQELMGSSMEEPWDEPTQDTIIPEILHPPVVLEDAYESALLGHTVAHNAQPRFVYSLNLLARREQGRAHISPEKARESVWKMVQDVTEKHGDRAPLFIDDEISRGGNTRRIIMP